MIKKLLTIAIVVLGAIALLEGIAVSGGVVVYARQRETAVISSSSLDTLRARVETINQEIDSLEESKAELVAIYDTLVRNIVGPYAEIITMVEDIRGLSAKEVIPVFPMTRAELAIYLEQDLADNYPPEEIAVDEKCLRMLGLLEAGDSLLEILLGSSTDSYAGFYIPSENKMYIITEDEEVSWYEKYIFSHEYEHFLQDQNWGIDTTEATFDEDNSDQYLAYNALLEGDAMQTETEFLIKLAIYHSDDFQALMDELNSMPYEESSSGYEPPDYWYDSMYFPYYTGMDFVVALKDVGGWEEVNKAFEAPPVSTEQIIHPEKYLDGDVPVPVGKEDRSSSIGAGWSLIDQDVLGELFTRYVLWSGNDIDDAETAAEGWDGDRVQFYENTNGDMVVLWESYWDSTTDRQEFTDAVDNFLQDMGYYSKTNVADDGKVTVIYGQEAGVDTLSAALF